MINQNLENATNLSMEDQFKLIKYSQIIDDCPNLDQAKAIAKLLLKNGILAESMLKQKMAKELGIL